MRQSILIISIMLILSACKSTVTDSPMLVGKVATDIPALVTILYDHDGDMYIDEITTDSTGGFTYNPELVNDAADLYITCGNLTTGARIAKRHTVNISIDGDQVTFSGDNAAESRFLSAYQKAYEYLKFKPKPQQGYDYSHYLDILNNGYAEATAALADISNDSLRTYYNQLNDTKYQAMLLNVYQCDQAINGTDHSTACDSILDNIDPNADITRHANLLSTWRYYRGPKQDGPVGNLMESTVSEILLIDSVLVNEANKKALWESSAQMFMTFEDSVEEIRKFMDCIAPQLDRAPMLSEKFNRILTSKSNKVVNGDPIPSDPTLIAPDGSRCQLSSLLGGKIVYIDLWATWCAPCCREIPYLEKVAEHYKGNPEISFISISLDQDTEAWQKKVEADNPSWPQYIFDDVTGKPFIDAMAANAIPRFLIIGRDSCFISVAAQRPSDTALIATLDEAIANK